MTLGKRPEKHAVLRDGGDILRKEPLGRQIAEYIKAAVFRRELLLGQTITELAIARKLGVSQAPVREALQMLMAEGIVTQQGARGKRIARPTPEEIRESYFAGGVLEGAVVAGSIGRFSSADTARLTDIVETMRARAAEGHTDAVAALDTEFHHSLFAKGGSGVIRELWYRSCQVTGKLLFHEKWRDTGQTSTVYARHKDILEALQARCPVRIETSIRAHYVSAGEILARHARELYERR